MSKTTGIGERLFLNQYDLSGDIGSLGTIQSARNQQDVTNITQVAIARLGLLYDGHLAYSGFFDTAAGAEHLVLRPLPQNGLTTWATGTAAGAPTGSMLANQADYNVTRSQDGSLTIDTSADTTGGAGFEWGNLLTTGLQLFASAGAGTYIDDYVPAFGSLPLPSTHGLSAFLHVKSLGSGTATVAVQDSTDHVSWANVSGAVFTAATGATSQRIAVGGNVNRYLRVNVTGTFTNLLAAVAVCRKFA